MQSQPQLVVIRVLGTWSTIVDAAIC
jgi:hypothetical protein